MNEKSIAKVNTRTTDLCIHCEKELKAYRMGGELFSFTNTGSGCFYCENNKCKFFGVLTLGRIPKTEKVVELEEKTPSHE